MAEADDPQDAIGNARPLSAADELRRIADEIGEPPDNPLGNVLWANRASAKIAWFTLRHCVDEEIADQLDTIAKWIDRVTATQTKATVAGEIQELQQKAGIRSKKKSDAVRVVPVNGRRSFRTQGRVQ